MLLQKTNRVISFRVHCWRPLCILYFSLLTFKKYSKACCLFLLQNHHLFILLLIYITYESKDLHVLSFHHQWDRNQEEHCCRLTYTPICCLCHRPLVSYSQLWNLSTALIYSTKKQLNFINSTVIF